MLSVKMSWNKIFWQKIIKTSEDNLDMVQNVRSSEDNISALIGYNGSTRRWFWKLIFIQKCQAYTLDKYFSRTGNFWSLANSKNIVGWSNQRRHVIFEISGHFVLELKWLLFGGFWKSSKIIKLQKWDFVTYQGSKDYFHLKSFFLTSTGRPRFYPNFLKIIQKLIFYSKINWVESSFFRLKRDFERSRNKFNTIILHLQKFKHKWSLF